MDEERFDNDLLDDMYYNANFPCELYFKLKEKVEQRTALNDSLRELSDFEQLILRLKHKHGINEEEIAGHLQISTDDVEDVLDSSLTYLCQRVPYHLTEIEEGFDNEL